MFEESREDFPFVSVIMPIRNEAMYIGHSLGAVLRQDYPPERMEVLIVDGMSTDNTREIVQQIRGEHPHYTIHILENPLGIAPTGLNIGVLHSSGKVIVRVDGHTVIETDYIRQCVHFLYSTKVDNVGGRMNAVGEGWIGQTVALATSSPFGVGGARFHYSEDEEWVDTVYMGAWWREVFVHNDLFDEELIRNQDDEFNYRLRGNGGRILLSPKIRSLYAVRSSPKALFRQYFQYGLWKVRVLQKHLRQMRVRQFIPPAFVAALIGSLVFAFMFSFGAVLLKGIMGAYILANFSVSIWMSPKIKLRHFVLLPLVFAILHVSYGLGFLSGLVKFANRWGDKKGKVPALEQDVSE